MKYYCTLNEKLTAFRLFSKSPISWVQMIHFLLGTPGKTPALTILEWDFNLRDPLKKNIEEGSELQVFFIIF